jgi:RNA polymerase sigma-70 factor (ECF subfamily)
MDVSGQTTLDRLETIYQTDFSRYLRVAAGITGDVESGLDAVHNAFVECIRTLRNYRGDGTLGAWVWRAVVNNSLKLVRARKAEAGIEFDADECAIEIPVVAESNGYGDVERIRSWIRDLPECERLILFLRYYADLEYGTIARTLQIRPGTVGAALHNAHATLRQRLEKESCHD